METKVCIKSELHVVGCAHRPAADNAINVQPGDALVLCTTAWQGKPAIRVLNSANQPVGFLGANRAECVARLLDMRGMTLSMHSISRSSHSIKNRAVVELDIDAVLADRDILNTAVRALKPGSNSSKSGKSLFEGSCDEARRALEAEFERSLDL